MYFEAFLTDLKSRVTISEVVGRSTKLRRDGKEFRAVDNASLTINDQKGLWWDQSTNEGGDALAWLQKMQGLSFTDAVAEIASMAGVPLPNGDGRERPRGGDRRVRSGRARLSQKTPVRSRRSMSGARARGRARRHDRARARRFPRRARRQAGRYSAAQQHRSIAATVWRHRRASWSEDRRRRNKYAAGPV